jgi:hypothetical protein
MATSEIEADASPRFLENERIVVRIWLGTVWRWVGFKAILLGNESKLATILVCMGLREL